MENETIRINTFVNTIINCDILDECFAGFSIYEADTTPMQKEVLTEQIINIYSIISPGYVEEATKVYLASIAKLTNFNQSNLLFSFLETLIHKNILKPKDVCFHILSFDFDFNNEVYWVNGFDFVRKIIHLVDYKGVRDFFTRLLSKIPLIPVQSKKSIYNQVDAFYKLLDYILDRNAALLPSYLLLDEIQKKAPALDARHWKFSKAISSFIDSFRPVAKIISVSGRPSILPIIGYPCPRNNPFKWEPKNAKYLTKCLLPFDKELLKPDDTLTIHVLEQYNSKDALVILGKNVVLERSLVKVLINTIKKTGNCKAMQAADSFESVDLNEPELMQIIALWQNLATTLLYQELIDRNPHFIIDLIKTFQQQIQQLELTDRLHLYKSREFIMWLMLEIISIYLPKNAYEGLTSLYNFFEVLYPEKEALALPDFSKQNSIYIMAAASIWCLLSKKCEKEGAKKLMRLPKAIELHFQALHEQIFSTNQQPISCSDFQAALLINSVETSNEAFQRVFDHFIVNVVGFRMLASPNGSPSMEKPPLKPVSMSILDSLTATSKISLLKFFTNNFVKLAQSKSTSEIELSLLETYHRLLVYTEIEANGIKDFINFVMSSILKHNSTNYLLSFLQMFSFRLFAYHVNYSYKNKFFLHLHEYFKANHVKNYEVFLYLESAILKYVYSINSLDFLSPINQQTAHTKWAMLIEDYCDTEELSKVFVMTTARAVRITGSEHLPHIANDLIKSNATNLTWPKFTEDCFPSVIVSFYKEQQAEKKISREAETQNQINQTKVAVEEEYRNWKLMLANEADLIKHFSATTTPPVFYCLLYKMLIEKESLGLNVYQILDNIGAKNLCTHLRTFTNYLLNEVVNLPKETADKSFVVLRDLIWKWNVFPIDRLLLCLALCKFEGNEINVSIYIIKILLFGTPDEQQSNELHSIVVDFVTDNTPEHWRLDNFCEKQIEFRRKHPEKFYFDHLPEGVGQGGQAQGFNSYGNLCLRILPVFDLILHRLIELQPNDLAMTSFDSLLDQYGCLYKFHHQPMTFLYHTLHYYEANLREIPKAKRSLVYSVVNVFSQLHPKGWAMTEVFLAKCAEVIEAKSEYREQLWAASWSNIGLDYYRELVGRLVDTMSNEARYAFPAMDYRFSEFPNAGTHALYVTCVELMALPIGAKEVANSLMTLVLTNHRYFPREDVDLLINAVALILVALPENYSMVLIDHIVEMLVTKPNAFEDKDLFYLFDFKNCHLNMCEYETSNLLALWHAFWNHANVGLFLLMPTILKERITPIVETEEQFIFVCYMVGPFLERFVAERTKCICDITIELYDMLVAIDKKGSELKYIDNICDLLYHNKYIITGDMLKQDLEKKIQGMREDLKLRLRFI